LQTVANDHKQSQAVESAGRTAAVSRVLLLNKFEFAPLHWFRHRFDVAQCMDAVDGLSENFQLLEISISSCLPDLNEPGFLSRTGSSVRFTGFLTAS
jgi:hypothetical protein